MSHPALTTCENGRPICAIDTERGHVVIYDADRHTLLVSTWELRRQRYLSRCVGKRSRDLLPLVNALLGGKDMSRELITLEDGTRVTLLSNGGVQICQCPHEGLVVLERRIVDELHEALTRRAGQPGLARPSPADTDTDPDR